MPQTNILIFILIGFIVSILSIIFGQRKSYNLVPKKIWTYWDNSNNSDNPNKMPKSVKLCIDSWKKTNPEYEITILTKKTYKGYITIPEEISKHPHFNDSIARFSDLVRLYVLAEHGGIWIDASVLVKKSFDEFLFSKYAEFSGYYMKSITTDPKYPVIESWFLAANKNSKFIQLWKNEFIQIGQFKDIQDYLLSRKNMGVNFEKIRDPNYLAIYVAALKILEVDKYSIDTLILRDSEEGPFRYLRDALWFPEKAMKLACSDKSYQTPLMKMRADERKILDNGIDYDLTNKVCKWIEL
jgi:hypothetical protein